MSTEESKHSKYQLIGPSDDGKIGDLLADLNPKDSQQRLQALIAGWLRMENLVVLTGSGCSCSSGGKTMAKLEKDVLSTVQHCSEVPATIGSLIEARLKSISAETHGTLGFEEWLSYLVTAEFVGRSTSSPFSGVSWHGDVQPSVEDLGWFVRRVGQAILAECALTLPDTPPHSSSPKDAAPHLAFLAKLVARDSNLGRAHVFTLNYDTLFEQALELLGIQYFDGFTGRTDARFDPSVYGLDIYYPGEVAEGRVRRFDKFLHLYKLHGSIHWHVHNDEMRARHPDLEQFAGYGVMPAEDKAAKLDKILDPKSSVGILPTANKMAQTLTMPFAHIFRSLQTRLGAPQTFLLVLGYAFGDDHVNRILETALMNPSLIMLVVEPDPKSATTERIREYKDLGKRAFLLTPREGAQTDTFSLATFADFSQSIMPDVQWLEDFLRLRRFEKQIQAVRHRDEITDTASSDSGREP